MSDVTERITSYLINGGAFNPELADHKAVRDLLIDARAELAAEREKHTETALALGRVDAERDALRAEAVSVAKMAEQISAQNGELVCENEALRELLREAREYTGYAAFYGDRIEADHAVDLCARIDSALMGDDRE